MVRLLSVFGLCCVLLTACSVNPSLPHFTQQDEETITRAHELFDEYQQLQALEQGSWPDFSVENNQARLQRYQQLQWQLESLPNLKLNADTYLSRDVLLRQLQVDIANAEHPEFTLFAAGGNGWPIRATNILLFEVDITNIAEAHIYLNYLSNLPSLLKQWQQQVEVAKEHNKLPPKMVIAAFQQQLQVLLDNEPLWADFNEKLDTLVLYQSSKTLLLNKARRTLTNQVNAHLQVMINKLDALQTEEGAWLASLEGQRYYHTLVKAYAGESLGAMQLHQFGVQEVTRINQEIAQLGQVFAEQKMLQAADFSVTEINQNAKKSAEYLAYAPQTPLALNVLTPAKAATVTLPYYAPASAVSGRPGVFYYVNQDSVAVTVYAEQLNAPYVHAQWALAQENTALPDFRRSLALASFNHGWSLFSQGIYAVNVQQQLGALLNELSAASKLVVDTGLHGEGWNVEQALTFLADNTPFTVSQQQHIVSACLSMPAQNTAATMQLQQLRYYTQRLQKPLSKPVNNAVFLGDLLAQGALPVESQELWFNFWRKN